MHEQRNTGNEEHNTNELFETYTSQQRIHTETETEIETETEKKQEATARHGTARHGRTYAKTERHSSVINLETCDLCMRNVPKYWG